jgi:hypothetical protein
VKSRFIRELSSDSHERQRLQNGGV